MWTWGACAAGNGSSIAKQEAEIEAALAAGQGLKMIDPFSTGSTCLVLPKGSLQGGGAYTPISTAVASGFAGIEKTTVLTTQTFHDDCPTILIVDKPETAE